MVVLWEEERGPLPLPFDVDVEEVEEVAGARGGGLLRAWRSCVVLRGGFISLVVGGVVVDGGVGVRAPCVDGDGGNYLHSGEVEAKTKSAKAG